MAHFLLYPIPLIAIPPGNCPAPNPQATQMSYLEGVKKNDISHPRLSIQILFPVNIKKQESPLFFIFTSNPFSNTKKPVETELNGSDDL